MCKDSQDELVSQKVIFCSKWMSKTSSTLIFAKHVAIYVFFSFDKFHLWLKRFTTLGVVVDIWVRQELRPRGRVLSGKLTPNPSRDPYNSAPHEISSPINCPTSSKPYSTYILFCGGRNNTWYFSLKYWQKYKCQQLDTTMYVEETRQSKLCSFWKGRWGYRWEDVIKDDGLY